MDPEHALRGALIGDIYDAIIDCLQGDPVSLARCALVCRDWTSRAQRRLFSAVVIRHHKGQLFGRTYPALPKLSRVLTGSPELARHVKAVTLSGQPPFRSASDASLPINPHHSRTAIT